MLQKQWNAPCNLIFAPPRLAPGSIRVCTPRQDLGEGPFVYIPLFRSPAHRFEKMSLRSNPTIGPAICIDARLFMHPYICCSGTNRVIQRGTAVQVQPHSAYRDLRLLYSIHTDD